MLTEVLTGCDKNVVKSFIYLKGMSLILVGKIRNKCCSNGRERNLEAHLVDVDCKTEDTIVTINMCCDCCLNYFFNFTNFCLFTPQRC